MKLPVVPVHSFEDATLNFEALQFPSSWTAPVLVNSWVGDSETPGYLRDSLGFVHLRGNLKTGTTNTTAFTLPPGFRPGQQYVYAQFSNGASTTGTVIVRTPGTVTLLYGTSGTNVALDGISFLAEN